MTSQPPCDVQPALLLCRLRLDVLLLGCASLVVRTCVEHHLVHVLDLVELLVEERLRARPGHLRPHRLGSLARSPRRRRRPGDWVESMRSLPTTSASARCSARRARLISRSAGAERDAGCASSRAARRSARGRAGAAEGRPGQEGCHPRRGSSPSCSSSSRASLPGLLYPNSARRRCSF